MSSARTLRRRTRIPWYSTRGIRLSHRDSLKKTQRAHHSANVCTTVRARSLEMTDDDERCKCSGCCQLMCDLLVNVGLLKPNTSMSISQINFDSRGDQLQPDYSTAIPRQQAQEEARPVLPDYVAMSERPSNSIERRLIALYARTLPSAVVQEQRVHQLATAYRHERQEPRYLAEIDPEPDILLR